MARAGARAAKPAWIGSREDRLQIAVAQYLDTVSRGGRAFYWFHVPNGGHRQITVARHMKAQGVKAGVWDCLLVGGGGVLFLIELKCEGRQGEKAGGLSDAQVDFRDKLVALGVPADHFATAYSVDEVETQLKTWGFIR